MRQTVMVLALSLLIVCSGVAMGEAPRQVPTTIWYQGFLADLTTGDPVDGTVDIIVRLYTLPVGGSVLWGPESHAGVTVTEGWFNIELGSVLPLPGFDGPGYYLDLRVDGEVMSQRMKLGSVPAAFQAAHADTASAAPDGGGSVWTEAGPDVYRLTGDVGIGTSSPGRPLHIKRDQNSTTGLTIENTDTGALSAERIDFVNEDGSVAMIALYDDEHGAYPGRMAIANNRPGGTMWIRAGGGAVFIDTTGHLGVGTTSPAAKLDVDGTARVEGVEMLTGASDGYVLTTDASGVGTWQELPAGGDSDWTVDGNNMYSAVAGSLGIGTSTPGALVNIVGDSHDDLVFESTANWGSVEIIAETPDGTYNDVKLSKYGSSSSASTVGLPLAGLGRLSSGVGADGLLLQVSSDDPMYFAAGDSVHMRIDPEGVVNILSVLHLEPTDTIPVSPQNGDMIVYGTAPSQGLYIYINDFWELLVGVVKDGEGPNELSGVVKP